MLEHFGVAIYAQIIPRAANLGKIVLAVPAISVIRPFVGGLISCGSDETPRCPCLAAPMS